jgi:hypothetical protein
MAPDTVSISQITGPLSPKTQDSQSCPLADQARAIRSCWHRSGAFQQYVLSWRSWPDDRILNQEYPLLGCPQFKDLDSFGWCSCKMLLQLAE